MPDEEKIDPKTGEPIKPEAKPGEEKKPADKPGEPTLPDYSQMSDEELDALITKEEAEKEIEWLRQEGLEHLGTLKKLAEGYKYLNDSDKAAFPIIKKLAEKYGVDPVAFAKRLETQLDKEPAPKKEEAPAKPTGPSALEIEVGKTQLDTKFLKFQRKMEKEDTDIPDDLQEKLEPLLTKVLYGLSKEQIAKVDWFGEAYDLYLFKLSKAKSPEELEEGLTAHKARQEQKRRQLGVPVGTKSKKLTKQETEEKEVWGDVSQLKED